MGKGTILVIDDELAICKVLSEWLGLKGYVVSYCDSAKEGLKTIQESSFDVILLDIKMPQMDGITLLKKIKEVDSNNLVIMMTAYPSDDTINQALDIGSYDYITKPFDQAKVCFLIERAVAYRRLVRSTATNPQSDGL